MNDIEQFWIEHIKEDPLSYIKLKDLAKKYREWYFQRTAKIITKTEFIMLLSQYKPNCLWRQSASIPTLVVLGVAWED